MEKLIIWIVLLVFFYLMNRISTWKKRAATAFLVVGQRATTKEERKWGYRNALRAGEQKAERFYVYSALEDFMDEKPMMPFKMKLSNGKKIPAIFIDYYQYPKGIGILSLRNNGSLYKWCMTLKTDVCLAAVYLKKHWQNWICRIVLLLYSCHAAIKANTLPDSAG